MQTFATSKNFKFSFRDNFRVFSNTPQKLHATKLEALYVLCNTYKEVHLSNFIEDILSKKIACFMIHGHLCFESSQIARFLLQLMQFWELSKHLKYP